MVRERQDGSDPETGGRYTLKRLRIAKWDDHGAVEAVFLRPDNPDFEAIPLAAGDGDVRIVAEFLEVLG